MPWPLRRAPLWVWLLLRNFLTMITRASASDLILSITILCMASPRCSTSGGDDAEPLSCQRSGGCTFLPEVSFVKILKLQQFAKSLGTQGKSILEPIGLCSKLTNVLLL